MLLSDGREIHIQKGQYENNIRYTWICFHGTRNCRLFSTGTSYSAFSSSGQFLLLRGSERFHGWFTQTKIYKNYLEDFEKNRSMTLKTKIGLLCLSSTLIAFPIFFVKNNYLRLALILAVIFKYYYFIFCIKTSKLDK